METNKQEQPIDALQNLFEEAEKGMLFKMPMWMRYNYVLDHLQKLLGEGSTDADINWDIVNNKLYTAIDPHDNNMCSGVHSFKELVDAREQCIESSLFNLAWRRSRCKDCHKEFILSYSECNFFERKGLALPKRCQCCRGKRKQELKNEK